MRVGWLKTCVLVLVAVEASAQAAPPVFEAGIEVINLTLSVTDLNGRYVTSLPARDFAVYEDGIRQDLSFFTNEDLPISLCLMIDTSNSMEEKLSRAQSAARRFVRTLRSQDAAQVLGFGVRVLTLQDFTNDQALLEAAIDRARADGPTPLHNALYTALKDLAHQKKAGERRRRAIILLTDGEDTSSLVTDEQIMELARKTEIGIYAISLRESRSESATRPEFSKAVFLLTTITRESGGQLFTPSAPSELEGVYDKIAEELRTQYSLGYISSNSRRDGRWRRIVVRLPGHKDLRIRHKLGYYGPAS